MFLGSGSTLDFMVSVGLAVPVRTRFQNQRNDYAYTRTEGCKSVLACNYETQGSMKPLPSSQSERDSRSASTMFVAQSEEARSGWSGAPQTLHGSSRGRSNSLASYGSVGGRRLWYRLTWLT